MEKPYILAYIDFLRSENFKKQTTDGSQIGLT